MGISEKENRDSRLIMLYKGLKYFQRNFSSRQENQEHHSLTFQTHLKDLHLLKFLPLGSRRQIPCFLLLSVQSMQFNNIHSL